MSMYLLRICRRSKDNWSYGPWEEHLCGLYSSYKFANEMLAGYQKKSGFYSGSWADLPDDGDTRFTGLDGEHAPVLLLDIIALTANVIQWAGPKRFGVIVSREAAYTKEITQPIAKQGFDNVSAAQMWVEARCQDRVYWNIAHTLSEFAETKEMSRLLAATEQKPNNYTIHGVQYFFD